MSTAKVGTNGAEGTSPALTRATDAGRDSLQRNVRISSANVDQLIKSNKLD